MCPTTVPLSNPPSPFPSLPSSTYTVVARTACAGWASRLALCISLICNFSRRAVPLVDLPRAK